MIFGPWYRWGGGGDSSATVATAPPFWTALSGDGTNWNTRNLQVQPRFQQIHAEGDTGPQFQQVTDAIG